MELAKIVTFCGCSQRSQPASPHYHLGAGIDNGPQYTIVINIEYKYKQSPMLLYYIGENYGVHDIHMNQGNEVQYESEDGVYQDGAFFIHYPAQNKWIAMFFEFQSQSFNTDEDGHRM